MEIKDWLTVRQAAQESGYSAEYLRELIRLKQIKAEKMGWQWLISRESLEKYRAEHKDNGR